MEEVMAATAGQSRGGPKETVKASHKGTRDAFMNRMKVPADASLGQSGRGQIESADFAESTVPWVQYQGQCTTIPSRSTVSAASVLDLGLFQVPGRLHRLLLF